LVTCCFSDKEIVFHVPYDLDRYRLDRAVLIWWQRAFSPERSISRGTLQHWIEQGAVQIDGDIAKSSQRIRAGSVVAIHPLEPRRFDLSPDATVPFNVLFEDDFLLVLHKPAGVLVHPAPGRHEPTLVHGLLAHAAALASDESVDGFPRPGIVHRLDEGTSGVMIVAKEDQTREGLKSLFAEHQIERSYLALVAGLPASQTVTRLHARHPKDRTRFTSRTLQGKVATTHFKVLETFLGDKAALVRCTLETGRTHQIRVHLAEVNGTPILGDTVYGSQPKELNLRKLAATLSHQALHAEVLGLVHPKTGIFHRWVSPLPSDVDEVLQKLRQMLALALSGIEPNTLRLRFLGNAVVEVETRGCSSSNSPTKS